MNSVWSTTIVLGIVATCVGCEHLKAPGSGSGPEATARKHLKVMLDAWKFGDSVLKFNEQHPDYMYIGLFDLDRPVKILRYEIEGCRPMELPADKKDQYEFAYEYVVVVTCETVSGIERKRPLNFRMHKLKNKSIIHFGEDKNPF